MAKRSLRTSYIPLAILWLGVTVGFAAIYWVLDRVPGQGVIEPLASGTPILTWYDALYFSMVTGTTVGFGDIVPIGWTRFFAALQSLTSFVVLAIFVSKFASQSQESTLAYIRALSEDASFNNIRHGLFIARKDLDILIRKIHERGEDMTDKDWKNLRTSLRQIQIFLRNIPNFYSARRHIGQIDPDREQLLLDSSERTLRRIVEAIDLLGSKGHACTADGKCMSELKSILASAEHTFIREHSKEVNAENEEAYREVRAQIEEIRTRL